MRADWTAAIVAVVKKKESKMAKKMKPPKSGKKGC